MNKKLVRLTEQDLHRIVKESLNRVLNEIGDTPRGQYSLGAVDGRNDVNDWYGKKTSRAGFDARSKANKARGNKDIDSVERQRMSFAYNAGRNYGLSKGRKKLGVFNVYVNYNDDNPKGIYAEKDGVIYWIRGGQYYLDNAEELNLILIGH